MGLFKGMKDMQQQAQQAVQQGMAQQQGMGGQPGMGGDMAAQAAYAQTAQKLYASGVEASAVVHSIRPTGSVDMGGGQWVEFDVSVKQADGTLYQTTIKQSMLPAQLEEIKEGAAITVRYDPDAPTSALIYGW